MNRYYQMMVDSSDRLSDFKRQNMLDQQAARQQRYENTLATRQEDRLQSEQQQKIKDGLIERGGQLVQASTTPELFTSHMGWVKQNQPNMYQAMGGDAAVAQMLQGDYQANRQRQLALWGQYKQPDNKLSNYFTGSDGLRYGVDARGVARPVEGMPAGVGVREDAPLVVNEGGYVPDVYAEKMSEHRAKSDSKRLDDYSASSTAARTELTRLQRMEQLLRGIETNKLTPTTKYLKEVAKGVGIDLGAFGIADDVAPLQAAEALSNQLALSMRNPAGGEGMPGAMSDADRAFLQAIVPGISQTSEGRGLLIQTRRKLAQRRLEEARIAREWFNKNKSFVGLEQELQRHADANPMFQGLALPEVKPTSAIAIPKDRAKYPEWGDVTEEDLQATMKAHGLNREQAIQRLSK